MTDERDRSLSYVRWMDSFGTSAKWLYESQQVRPTKQGRHDPRAYCADQTHDRASWLPRDLHASALKSQAHLLIVVPTISKRPFPFVPSEDISLSHLQNPLHIEV